VILTSLLIKRVTLNLLHHNFIDENPSGVAYAGMIGRQRHSAFGGDSDKASLKCWGCLIFGVGF
jgi:hypothetical protein